MGSGNKWYQIVTAVVIIIFLLMPRCPSPRQTLVWGQEDPLPPNKSSDPTLTIGFLYLWSGISLKLLRSLDSLDAT